MIYNPYLPLYKLDLVLQFIGKIYIFQSPKSILYFLKCSRIILSESTILQVQILESEVQFVSYGNSRSIMTKDILKQVQILESEVLSLYSQVYSISDLFQTTILQTNQFKCYRQGSLQTRPSDLDSTSFKRNLLFSLLVLQYKHMCVQKVDMPQYIAHF